MKLYNTLSRQLEEFRPINPPIATIYTCGPTVYDYPHIGNWFTFVRYDVLVRTIAAQGLEPRWVMNITDVGHLVSDADEGEDKLEKGARREGKTAYEIADFYSTYFIDGLKRLNISTPQFIPKATDHISEQIELVRQLEAKGYTYRTSDGIYYDTARFIRYADFARLDVDEQQAGARVEYNTEKRNATDFALWKFSPAGQKRDMEWDSPWGVGFPGWHLECSAMSMKYLGETMDIHSGGIDHIPVHHTNEIAQSEAVTGKPVANLWMHTNHITIEGGKISKSLGNGITLEDIEAKGFSTADLRMHILESHYRSQSKFSWESLESSRQSLKNIQDGFGWIYQSNVPSDTTLEGLTGMLAEYRKELTETLANDLNTPQAVALLHKYSGVFAAAPASRHDILQLESFGQFVEALLGIDILGKQRFTLDKDAKAMIMQRDGARRQKDWANADMLRDQLTENGLQLLKDTAHGSIWYRAKYDT